MLPQLHKRRPFQLSLDTLKPVLNSPTHEHSHYNYYYKPVCDALLSLTRSRSLPKGLQIHAHIIKSGIHSIPLVSHNLINFYSKTRLPLFARQVFDETSVRSSTTWSSAIACLAQNELPLEALELFRRMLGEGLRADDHIFPSAAKAAAILGGSETGGSVHGLVIKTGFVYDVFVGSSVVDMYCKCRDMRGARSVFDEMPSKNVVSWTGMISGYVQSGEDEEALRLFKRALFEGVEANDFTFSCVVRGCGNSTLLELGRQVHGRCFKSGFDDSPFVATSLVSLYARCGLIEAASRVFRETKEKNLGLWNAMLISHAQHAEPQRAFAVFESMRSLGTKPNFITFLGLLYACSHSGLVEEGKRFFDAMKNEHGIEPEPQHYASLVDLLARSGNLREAVSVVEGMGIEPTEGVWGALLSGCGPREDAELVGQVADMVSSRWGSVGPGLHVLLSKAYASAGRWEDSARVRKGLRDRGERKETGLSWVEDGERVHAFASGDRAHPRAHEIYAKLEELEWEIEKLGYVPDTSFAMRRSSGGEEERVRCHSERLAVAFGLVAFPAERPIRVMKNLRVCGDCHNAIKLVSKCSGRVIILRDYNRFHRFEDGKCSCGDYW